MSQHSNPPFGGPSGGGHGPVIVPLTTVVRNAIESLITANTVSVPEQEDPFDQAFDNTFAPSVKATINGQTKTREQLRKFILQIRDSLNGETAAFTQLIEHEDKDGSESVRAASACFLA